jgi:hypothetical protein
MSDSVDFPRAWRFHSDDGDADGATFEGRFTGIIEQGETSYGTKPVARFVEEATGEEVSIWLFNQSLLDQLSKLSPEKDELVKIDWYGKKTSKTTGRKYQSFKATAPERPVVQLSWAALGTVEEEEEDN